MSLFSYVCIQRTAYVSVDVTRSKAAGSGPFSYAEINLCPRRAQFKVKDADDVTCKQTFKITATLNANIAAFSEVACVYKLCQSNYYLNINQSALKIMCNSSVIYQNAIKYTNFVRPCGFA